MARTFNGVSSRDSTSGDQQRERHAFCGAKKKNGELCRNYAGLGTDHVGVGQCKLGAFPHAPLLRSRLPRCIARHALTRQMSEQKRRRTVELPSPLPHHSHCIRTADNRFGRPVIVVVPSISLSRTRRTARRTHAPNGRSMVTGFPRPSGMFAIGDGEGDLLHSCMLRKALRNRSDIRTCARSRQGRTPSRLGWRCASLATRRSPRDLRPAPSTRPSECLGHAADPVQAALRFETSARPRNLAETSP